MYSMGTSSFVKASLIIISNQIFTKKIFQHFLRHTGSGAAQQTCTLCIKTFKNGDKRDTIAIFYYARIPYYQTALTRIPLWFVPSRNVSLALWHCMLDILTSVLSSGRKWRCNVIFFVPWVYLAVQIEGIDQKRDKQNKTKHYIFLLLLSQTFFCMFFSEYYLSLR